MVEIGPRWESPYAMSETDPRPDPDAEPQAASEDGATPTPAPAEPDPAQAAEPAVAPPAVLPSPVGEALLTLARERDQNRDRLLRTAADFDNYKKRSKRDQTDAVRRAEERVAQDFLPVIDNLERALAHAAGSDDTLAAGVRMVHKQFLSALEKHEIRPFDSVDQPFNPELHEAVQQAASDKPVGTVCLELQRGYRRGDKLVRAAMVVVSTGPATAAPPGAGGEPDAGSGSSAPAGDPAAGAADPGAR